MKRTGNSCGNTQLSPAVESAVRAHQVQRLARMRSLAGSLTAEEGAGPGPTGPPFALAYALAHHALRRLERSARAGLPASDPVVTGSMQQLCSPPADTGWPSVIGRVGVVRADLDELNVDPSIADMPTFDATPIRMAATGPHIDLVVDAVGLAADHGFGDLLLHNLGVVVLMRERSFTEPTDCWSTAGLPATVHMDFVPEPALMSRDLVHECAHTDLNQVLTALEIAMPDDVSFYAPWRRTERPLFGFLHGCWAFSTVLALERSLLDHQPELSEDTRRYLHDSAELNRGRLKSVGTDLRSALKHLPNPELAATIADRYDWATAR